MNQEASDTNTDSNESELVNFALTPAELLQRHQLNLLDYWAVKEEEKKDPKKLEVSSSEEPETLDSDEDGRWSLTKNINLHKWQQEACVEWFRNSGSGVVKVVTGAGKTIFALSVMERLQTERVPNLRVVITVPTIILMEQWYDTILQLGNLPATAIGRMGGGHSDQFEGNILIMIAVLTSAAEKLETATRTLNPDNLLLIVDECHRAGADKMSQIFKMKRSYSLGLSATPERENNAEKDEDDSDENSLSNEEEPIFENTILGRELGPIIYELDFSKAISLGILPTFEVRHYGLTLNPSEKVKYEKISREISDLRKILQEKGTIASGSGGKVVGYARRIAGRQNSPLAETARRFVQLTGDRKRLLYNAKARNEALLEVVRMERERNPGAKFLLFHESIAEVMRIFYFLRAKKLPAVAEHSQLADSLRRESIHLFRNGSARMLVSARSLVEGFDVPSADVGIVVASSSSVRQRVQTLGRILRKHKDGEEEKSARLHVFYISETTDEFIYEKHNWEDFLGAERNLYFRWDLTNENSGPTKQDGPPRTPLPGEDQINIETMKPGDTWPGAWEGTEIKGDQQGNFRNHQGQILENSQELADILESWTLRHKTIKIAAAKKSILAREEDADGWKTIFLGTFEHDLRFSTASDNEDTREDLEKVQDLEPGSILIGNYSQGEEFHVRQKRGKTRIAKELKDKTVFAREMETASDIDKGKEAEALIKDLDEAGRTVGYAIKKFRVIDGKLAIAEAAGRTIFIRNLHHQLEIPQ